MFRKIRELLPKSNNIRSDEDIPSWAVRTAPDAFRFLRSGRRYMVEVDHIKPDDSRALSQLALCVDVRPMYQSLTPQGYEVITPSRGWIENTETGDRRPHCFAWKPDTDEIVDYTAAQMADPFASSSGNGVTDLITRAPDDTTELDPGNVVVLHGKRSDIRLKTGLHYLVPSDRDY